MSIDITVETAAARSPETDRTVALVRRAAGGDHDAYTILIEPRLEPTFRTLMAVLGDESDARDAAQMAFVQVWTNLPRLREPERFDAWFGRIVVNQARDALRRRRRGRVREVAVSSVEDVDARTATMPVDQEDRTAALDRLMRAFDRLPADDRVVLWLHLHEGLALAEIAPRLGIAPQTVKSRLFSARRRLEQGLRAEDR